MTDSGPSHHGGSSSEKTFLAVQLIPAAEISRQGVVSFKTQECSLRQKVKRENNASDIIL